MRKFAFYDLSTGRLTGRTYSGPEAWLRINTPEGCAAIEVAADEDLVGRAVDLASGQLRCGRPEQPAGDEWRCWVWDDAAGRWQSQPTLAALKSQARAPVLQALQDADVAAVRPLAEMMAGARSADAQAVLAQILERKETLRQELRDIDAATDQKQLQELPHAARPT